MRALALPRRDWPWVIAGGLLVPLAYPPFHLLVPSFVCLVPAVWLLHQGASDPRPLRRHLLQGAWFGLLSQALVLYWMIVALWHFTPLSALGYLATIAILAAWNAGLFGLTGWIRRRTGFSWLAIFPVTWTAVEWAIGHQSDIRFPWLGLGTSLTGFPVLVQIADLIGARGITFLLALANTALALAWIERHQRARLVRRAGAVLLGVAAAAGYGFVRMRTLELRTLGTAVLLQPNIGFREKWNPAYQDSIVALQFHLADQAIAATRPGLVVWPEAALPQPLPYYPDWVWRLSRLARAAGVPMVVGGIDAAFLPGGRLEYYNAAFVYDADGRPNPAPQYRKHYLVPIVERVPFVNPRWFARLRWFGAFGKGDWGPVYRTAFGRFGVLICYESAFENLSRRYRRLGADFLVNITNDAWFGNTSAPYQHAAHLVMRAIETRMGVARAANSGISELVDPLGRVHHATRLGQRTFQTGPVTTTAVRTWYVTLGDWVGLLVLVATGALVAAAWRRAP